VVGIEFPNVGALNTPKGPFSAGPMGYHSSGRQARSSIGLPHINIRSITPSPTGIKMGRRYEWLPSPVSDLPCRTSRWPGTICAKMLLHLESQSDRWS
jgi:hypothetical protein